MRKLDLNTLESWLWDSANILRGSIDSSDFKNYIFGLLFLKRANDVFDEEIETIMKRDKIQRSEAEDESFFNIPAETRWETIKLKLKISVLRWIRLLLPLNVKIHRWKVL